MKKRYRIGYIAGVFDLFHVGHLNVLENAKAYCNYLIVGVLSDDLVVHFKSNPPVIPCMDRMRIIENIKCVDEAVEVTFENIDKVDAWNLYHYDCLFSGDDYKDNPVWLADREKLRALGSDIEFFPYTQRISSTKIKQKMSEEKQ